MKIFGLSKFFLPDKTYSFNIW